MFSQHICIYKVLKDLHIQQNFSKFIYLDKTAIIMITYRSSINKIILKNTLKNKFKIEDVRT